MRGDRTRCTLLPLGGTHKGYKGFGLALMVGALTQGLADFGRADPPAPMSLAVFVRVIDPEAFGGHSGFARRAGFIADACRAVPPAPGVRGVRVPGDGAARSRRGALAEGVAIDPAMLNDLGPAGTQPRRGMVPSAASFVISW